MTDRNWDSGRLSDLLSNAQAVRFAAESYFDSLEPDAVSDVLATLKAESLYWQRWTAAVIFFGAAVGLVVFWCAAIAGSISVGLALAIFVVAVLLPPVPVLLLRKQRGLRQKGLTRALLFLRGDQAVNEILSNWSSADQPLADGELRQLAAKNIVRQINESKGVMPAIAPKNRRILCNYASYYLRKKDSTDVETDFGQTVLKWSDNLFEPRERAKLNAARGDGSKRG